MRPLPAYRTFVFDCDGVVLDSNRIKTDAFYQAALPYGEAAAQALVQFHLANGGISRYRKFEHFLAVILGRDIEEDELRKLLDRYASQVRDDLLLCAHAPGLHALREALPDTRWLIVSGGDQAELRTVFATRGLAELFDGGIFGSPETKEAILARERECGTIQLPALFLGDSRYDHECASAAGLDFAFMTQWTEFQDWKAYFAGTPAMVMEHLGCLAGMLPHGPQGGSDGIAG